MYMFIYSTSISPAIDSASGVFIHFIINSDIFLNSDKQFKLDFLHSSLNCLSELVEFKSNLSFFKIHRLNSSTLSSIYDIVLILAFILIFQFSIFNFQFFTIVFSICL